MQQRNITIVRLYREPLKGSSQVGRICGGKIASFCLQKVTKRNLLTCFHIIWQEPFRHSLYCPHEERSKQQMHVIPQGEKSDICNLS